MTECAEEIRRRIKVSVWAYAYELMDESPVHDHVFDREARLVRPEMRTSYQGRDNRTIDRFFREQFSPDSGLWIRHHPDIKGIERVYSIIKGLGRQA